MVGTPAYKFWIYMVNNKSVIKLEQSRKPMPFDEIQVDVPTWAEYDKFDGDGNRIAQFVMAGIGVIQVTEQQDKYKQYRKIRVVEGELADG